MCVFDEAARDPPIEAVSCVEIGLPDPYGTNTMCNRLASILPSTPPPRRRGYTLVELIVTIVVVIVLFAILMPLLIRSRDFARTVTCRNQLRQIGLALDAYADVDSSTQERYCTGSFDWGRDGCPEYFSWLATVRTTTGTSAESSPSKLAAMFLCPSNPIHTSAGVRQMETFGFGDGENPATFDCGFCNSQTGLLSVPANSPQRKAMVDRLVQRGWNTNYAASWHLVRGQPRLTRIPADSATFRVDVELARNSPSQYRVATNGPLTRRQIDTADVPSSNMPLLGDANSSDSALTLRSDSTAAIEGAGPSAYSMNSRDVIPVTAAVPFSGQVLLSGRESTVEQLSVQAALIKELGYSGPILQDMRHWRAVHGKAANILMVDGSVKSIFDRNGDGLMDPGFPASTNYGGTASSKTGGHRDREIEPTEIISHTWLSEYSRPRGCPFDD